MTIPSKVQFSLAFGKPIVAAVSGDPAGVLRNSDAAFICAPGDPDALTNTVLEASSQSTDVLDQMGRRGREYFLAQFSEAVAGNAMADLLASLVPASRRRS